MNSDNNNSDINISNSFVIKSPRLNLFSRPDNNIFGNIDI